MPVLKRLFEPVKIGNTEIRNRIVMLGMGLGFGERYGVTNRIIRFFEERAIGGVGLIIVGSLFVADFEDVKWAYEPAVLSLGIWDDSFIPGLKRLTETVHKHGAKIAAQLSLNYEWRADKSRALQVVGPSAGIKSGRIPESRELTIGEIGQIVDQFADGARRARQAGFDAAEFHAGNGFLINQFLSPRTNKRIDRYGGSVENRMRFFLEIIEAAKKKAGGDFTLTCRFSGEEMMDGGLKLEDTLKMVPVLEKAGLAAINAQVGTEQTPIPLIQQWVPPGAYVYVAEAFKKVLNIPVITAYRIKDPMLAESIIAGGRADLIGMARALLADPEWPNKAKQGRFIDINTCISCCRCLDDIMEPKPIACTVNGRLGREFLYPSLQPVLTPKNVAVIGGGPGGMEVARVAALRGHNVTLYEKGPRLGGSVVLASIVNDELEPLLKHWVWTLRKTPVNTQIGREFTPEVAVETKPDIVVLASGGTTPSLGASQSAGRRVLTGHDILEIVQGHSISGGGFGEKALWFGASVLFRYFYTQGLVRWLSRFNFPFGKSVTIIGGGFAGCELADFLASRDKKVTIIGESSRVGEGIGVTTRWVVRRRLRDAGVRMIENAKVEAITDRGVAVKTGDATEVVATNTIVLARPLLPNRGLEEKLKGKVPVVYAIGDCVEPAKIKETISRAVEVGMTI